MPTPLPGGDVTGRPDRAARRRGARESAGLPSRRSARCPRDRGQPAATGRDQPDTTRRRLRRVLRRSTRHRKVPRSSSGRMPARYNSARARTRHRHDDGASQLRADRQRIRAACRWDEGAVITTCRCGTQQTGQKNGDDGNAAMTSSGGIASIMLGRPSTTPGALRVKTLTRRSTRRGAVRTRSASRASASDVGAADPRTLGEQRVPTRANSAAQRYPAWPTAD